MGCYWLVRNWMRRDARLANYCHRPNVKYMCARSCSTCGEVCADDPQYVFELNDDPGVYENCAWITEIPSQIELRREENCDDVGEFCPEACGFCPDPISQNPSMPPSDQPSKSPTVRPSSSPSIIPSSQPTNVPSSAPSVRPSVDPTTTPSRVPSERPSADLSDQPSAEPTLLPTQVPSNAPSKETTGLPSSTPSDQPSSAPSLPCVHCGSTLINFDDVDLSTPPYYAEYTNEIMYMDNLGALHGDDFQTLFPEYPGISKSVVSVENAGTIYYPDDGALMVCPEGTFDMISLYANSITGVSTSLKFEAYDELYQIVDDISVAFVNDDSTLVTFPSTFEHIRAVAISNADEVAIGLDDIDLFINAPCILEAGDLSETAMDFIDMFHRDGHGNNEPKTFLGFEYDERYSNGRNG